MLAKAVAFGAFFALPSVLLVAVGLFTLIAGPGTIDSLIAHLHTVLPGQARELISASLHRLDHRPSTSIAVTVIGFLLAVWSMTGAMTSFMTAVNLAYEHKDQRSFVRRRLVALVMAACAGFAFMLVAVLLLVGPTVEKHVGRALGIQGALAWIWWIAEWPILVVALFVVFATLLFLAPDMDGRRWRFVTPGAAVATAIWLVASGAFAFYTSRFSSYNKAWGSLAAVIVMLMWLWLTSLALLFGAEIDSEIDRRRARL